MTNVHTVNSMISNRNRDCLECRLLSGSGLVAAGLYVCHHSKQYQKQVGKAAMYSVASGMSGSSERRVGGSFPLRGKAEYAPG